MEWQSRESGDDSMRLDTNAVRYSHWKYTEHLAKKFANTCIYILTLLVSIFFYVQNITWCIDWLHPFYIWLGPALPMILPPIHLSLDCGAQCNSTHPPWIYLNRFHKLCTSSFSKKCRCQDVILYLHNFTWTCTYKLGRGLKFKWLDQTPNLASQLRPFVKFWRNQKRYGGMGWVRRVGRWSSPMFLVEELREKAHAHK